MDCSGFAQRVYEEVGYDFPDDELNSRAMRNHFETQDEAEVGGLMYIEPAANSNIPNVVIVTEVDDDGEATEIIDSAGGQINGIEERTPPASWEQRGYEYLELPDAEQFD